MTAPNPGGEGTFPAVAAAPPPAAVELVVRLGRALHTAGSPAHRIEQGMTLASRRLGLAGQFFSTPTALFAAFGSGEHRRTVLERVEPGEVNLERLRALGDLLDGLAAGRLEPDAAARELELAIAAPERYGAGLTTLSFSLASAAAAQLFGGGWREVVAAAAVGLLIGLLARGAAALPAAARLFEPVAAVLAAALAGTLALALTPLSPFLVTLAGLIVLIPGFTLTVATTELATRHLVSGAARLAGALIVFLGLAFGVAVGTRLVAVWAGPVAALVHAPLPDAARWAAVPVIAFAFTVLFRAHPRDGGWILLAGVLAVEGVRLGALLLGPQLAAFLGALLVGVVGNGFARLLRRPAALIQVPGLVLLVPGSMGFRSLAALLEQDVLSGVQTAFATTLVAISLAMGLLLASVILPPRGVV